MKAVKSLFSSMIVICWGRSHGLERRVLICVEKGVEQYIRQHNAGNDLLE